MAVVPLAAECAQCGRDVPLDTDELSRWRHGDLVLEGELDEVTASMIVCPDCDADELRDFDQGDPG